MQFLRLSVVFPLLILILGVLAEQTQAVELICELSTPLNGQYYTRGERVGLIIRARGGDGTEFASTDEISSLNYYVSGTRQDYRAIVPRTDLITAVNSGIAYPVVASFDIPASPVPGSYSILVSLSTSAGETGYSLKHFKVAQVQSTVPSSLPPEGWMGCGKCHENGDIGHRRPQGLSLNESLEYCLVCHAWGSDKPFGPTMHVLLEHDNVKVFRDYPNSCAVCHDNSEGNDLMNKAACRSCHPNVGPTGHFGFDWPDDTCTFCHNDIFAPLPDTVHRIEPGQYVTSETCAACHTDEYQRWDNTAHAHALKPVDSPFRGGVIGDFAQNPVLSDPANNIPPVTIHLSKQDNSRIVTLGDGGPTYPVDRVQGGGGGWKQRYQTIIGKSYYILPIQWNEKDQKWVAYDLNKWFDAQGNPKTPAKADSFERRCLGCHSTDLHVAYDGQTGEYMTTHSELNVGCEACHGPASGHINAGGGSEGIINPEDLSLERAGEVCGRCHGRGDSTYVNSTGDGKRRGYPWSPEDREFRPGDVLSDFYTFTTSSSDLWPDGTAKSHHQQYMDYIQSSKATDMQEKVTCFSCHDPHGSPNEFDVVASVKRDSVEITTQNDDNTLCLACHAGDGDFAAITKEMVANPMQNLAAIGAVVNKHTGHELYFPMGEGFTAVGRCSKCHMPKVAKSAVPYDIHSHTFRVIEPEETLTYFMPSSCAVSCHRQLSNVVPTAPGFGDANLANWGERTDVALAKFLNGFHKQWYEHGQLLPVLPDSDGDGMPDHWEIIHGLLPGFAGDATADPDADSYTNLQEYGGSSDPQNGNSKPYSAKIEVVALSPSLKEKDAEGNRITTSGLSNIPVGTHVRLSGSGTDWEGNPVQAYTWSLLGPPGFTATLDDPSSQTVDFVPDQVGEYRLELRVGDAGPLDSPTATQILVAGTWLGKENCQVCHSGRYAERPGWELADLYTPWTKTHHGTAFTRKISTPDHFSDRCVYCHVVGDDRAAAAVNSGWDDWASQLGWTFPPVLQPGNWKTIQNSYPSLENLANIQCENCHGPGSEHRAGKGVIGVSLKSGVCGQCHDSPTGHIKDYQWDTSAHARALQAAGGFPSKSASCLKCMTAEGFVDVFVKGKDTEVIEDPSPITCATCHDPHTDAYEHHFRFFGIVELANGRKVNMGKGAVCAKCHTDQGAYPGHAPHHPQAEMFSGTGGAEFAGVRYTSSPHLTLVPDACSRCHMFETPGSGEPGHNLVGEHTYKVAYDNGTPDNPSDDVYNVRACTPCHTGLTNFNVNGTQDHIASLIIELEPLLPKENGGILYESTATTALSEDEKHAAFNYSFVEADASQGVHNAIYAKQLVWDSITALDADHDGSRDEVDPDADGDGIANAADALPLDTDNDGMTNLVDQDDDNDSVSDIEEYATGADFLTFFAYFLVKEMNVDQNGNAVIRWQSVPGKTYTIQYAEMGGSTFQWRVAEANFPAAAAGNETVWVDDGSKTPSPSSAAGGRFYRVQLSQ